MNTISSGTITMNYKVVLDAKGNFIDGVRRLTYTATFDAQGRLIEVPRQVWTA